MRRNHAVVFAVAAGLLVTVVLLWPDDAVEAPRGDADTAAAGSVGTSASGVLVEPSANDPTRREATPEPAAVEAWLAHPYTLGLEVRLVDATGLPIPQRSLQWAARGCTLEDFGEATDADGIARRQWPARAAVGQVVLADPLGLLHRITVQHGVERKVTLGGRSVPEATGGLHLSVRSSRGAASGSQPVLLTGIPFVRDFDTPSTAPDAQLHPFSVFRTAAAAARRLAGVEFITETSVWFSISSMGIDLTEHLPAAAPPPIHLAGTVFGEDGKPVANAPVTLLHGGPESAQHSTTDEQGQFRFEKLAAGEYTVRAGGDRDGLGTVTTTLASGTTTVAVHLQTGTTVRGVATTGLGKPFAHALLMWLADDRAWWDLTSADEHGRFQFANLPDGRGTVLLLPPAQNVDLPLAVQANVLANAGELVLAHDPAQTGMLRLELPDWVTATGEEVAVRLWNDDLGLGIQLGRQLGAPQTPNVWTAENLASGWYRLEVLVPSLGCIDLGRQWLEPAGKLEFSNVQLPPPVSVELRLGDAPPAAAASDDDTPPPPPGPQSRLELYAIRNDLDVRLAIGELVDHCDLRLPGGDYALARQAQGGPLEWHRFTARRGEVVRVPASK